MNCLIKTLILTLLLAIFASLITANFCFAHGEVDLPTPGKCIYDRSCFTCVPAVAGGSVLAIPFGVIGFCGGLLTAGVSGDVPMITAGVLCGLIVGNVTGNIIIGGLFYLIERTVTGWNKEVEE